MRLSLDWWDRYIDKKAREQIAEDTEFLMSFVVWTPWFAWFPVVAEADYGSGSKGLVWLEMVDRGRVAKGVYSPRDCLASRRVWGADCGWSWEYRPR